MSLFIETLRIEEGRIHNLAYHNARMNQTRREVFGLGTPLDLSGFICPEEYRQRTKCRVAYAEEIEDISYALYTMRPVCTLRVVECDDAVYRYKSTDRRFLDGLFGQRGAYDDILIVRNGLLTDTSICNIALWDGYSWITPSQPLLHGTMRASLLDAGQIALGDIPVADLQKYPRIRLFNAMIGFGELEVRNDKYP